MAQRLLVIDGADQGRVFALTEGSTLLIGSSTRQADICLNDLYVKRVHCLLHVGDHVVVKDHQPNTGGVFVNGQRVTEQELRLGDVLRVGNSHLRLEIEDSSRPAEDKETAKEGAKETAP